MTLLNGQFQKFFILNPIATRSQRKRGEIIEYDKPFISNVFDVHISSKCDRCLLELPMPHVIRT